MKSFKEKISYWFKYGFKAYAIRFYLVAVTLLAACMAYFIVERDKALEDFELVRHACPQEMRIEARAEQIIWGRATNIVFYCI